jgi:Cytochrome C'
MIKMFTIRLVTLSLGASVLLCGFTQSDVTKAAEKAMAAVPTSALALTPPFSINEMMVEIVDHPGELLWEIEKGHTPKTGEDWYELENHAIALAGAATLIQLGGTGPEDAKWASQSEWKKSAQQLGTAALTARQAAKSRNLAALIDANGQIVDACESCHNKFKPDIPTGKLFIHHRPGVDPF